MVITTLLTVISGARYIYSNRNIFISIDEEEPIEDE